MSLLEEIITSQLFRLHETELLAVPERRGGVGVGGAVVAVILEGGHDRVVGGPAEPQPRASLLSIGIEGF